MSPGEPSAWSLKSPRVGLPQSKEAGHPFLPGLPGSDDSMWGHPLPPDFTEVATGWLAPVILSSSEHLAPGVATTASAWILSSNCKATQERGAVPTLSHAPLPPCLSLIYVVLRIKHHASSARTLPLSHIHSLFFLPEVLCSPGWP